MRIERGGGGMAVEKKSRKYQIVDRGYAERVHDVYDQL